MPRLDEVLVVDNASTDGTGEWLATPDADRVLARTLEAQHAAVPVASMTASSGRWSAAPIWSG